MVINKIICFIFAGLNPSELFTLRLKNINK